VRIRFGGGATPAPVKPVTLEEPSGAESSESEEAVGNDTYIRASFYELRRSGLGKGQEARRRLREDPKAARKMHRYNGSRLFLGGKSGENRVCGRGFTSL
jgi:hypothetical protein